MTTNTSPGAMITKLIADELLVAHLNEQHGYTIPPDAPQLQREWVIKGLHREHLAIHAEHEAQQHEEGR